MLGESPSERITLKASSAASDIEPEMIERFESKYFLAPVSRLDVITDADRQVLARAAQVHEHIAQGDLKGAAEIIEWVEHQQRDASPPGHDDAVRRLFARSVVAFFAERPGWHIESAGGRLAVWRDRQVLPAAQRPAMLEDALAIRQRVLKR